MLGKKHLFAHFPVKLHIQKSRKNRLPIKRKPLPLQADYYQKLIKV